MSKISWQDLFELGDDTPITDAIKKINDFGNALEGLMKKMEASSSALAEEYAGLQKESDELLKKTVNMNLALEEEAKALEKVAIEAENLEKEDAALKKSQEDNIAAMKKLQDAAEQLEKSKKKLKDNNTAEAGSINDLKAKLKEAEKAYLDMGDATDKAVKTEAADNIKKLKTQIQESSVALKQTKEQAQFAAGSYYELNQRVSEAKKRLKEMEGGIDANGKEFKQLQREIKEGSDKLKDFDEEIGDNQRNVGDYAGQIERLVPGFGMIAQGAGVADKSLMKLAMNPIGLVLIAISTALAGLTAWFKSTGEGQDKLAEGMAFLGQIGNNIIKMLATLGEFLYNAFSNPQKALNDLYELVKPLGEKLKAMWEDPIQAVKDLGQLIVDNIINRFKAIGVAGEAIVKIFKGDLKAGFKQLADAGIQATTGIENGTDKLVEGFNAATDAAKKLWATLTEGTDIAVKLEQRQDALDERRRNNLVKTAQTELDVNKLLQNSRDKLNFTDSQRIGILKEANDLILKQSQEDLAIAKEALAIKQAQIKLATDDPTDEQMEEIRKLQAEVINVQAKFYQETRRTNAQLVALELEIEKARLERIAKQQKAESDLMQTRLNAEIKVNEEVIADQETTFARRNELLQENADKRAQILEEQKKLELSAIDRATADKILTDGIEHELELRETARLEKEAIEAKYAESTRQINEKLMTDLENNVFTQLAEDLDVLTSKTKTASNEEVLALTEAFKKGEISAKEYTQQRLALDADLQEQLLRNQLAGLEQQLAELQKYGHDVTDVLEKISDVRRQIEEEDVNNSIARQETLKQATVQAAMDTYNVLTQIGGEYFAAREAEATARREKIEADYERDINLAGDNLAQREAIEAEYVEKRRKAEQDEIAARRKRAQFEKAIAATQIVINTAQAIGRTLAEVPKFDFGISTAVLVGLYSALGAAQLATVLARPIPAYEKGTRHSVEGWALVGEKGTELVQSPTGDRRFVGQDGAELTYLKGGSKVYNASETERMINDAGLALAGAKAFGRDAQELSYGDVMTMALIDSFNEKLDSLEYTIRTKKEFHLNITSEGVEKAVKNGLDWTKYLNDYYG